MDRQDTGHYPLMRVLLGPQAPGIFCYFHGFFLINHLDSSITQYQLCKDHNPNFPPEGIPFEVKGDSIQARGNTEFLAQMIENGSIPFISQQFDLGHNQDYLPLQVSNFFVELASRRSAADSCDELELVGDKHHLLWANLHTHLGSLHALWALPPPEILWPMIVAHRDKAIEKRVGGLLGRTKSRLRADLSAMPSD